MLLINGRCNVDGLLTVLLFNHIRVQWGFQNRDTAGSKNAVTGQ